MKKIIMILIPFIFTGCAYVNDCGISSSYYNDCKEYYDSMGIYHKECPENNIYNKCEKKPQDSLLKDCINCN